MDASVMRADYSRKESFISNGSKPAPAFAANLDIFGYGDTFFTTASKPAGMLANALQRAGMEGGIAVRFSPPAQYPSSGHSNMMAAGVETLEIALIDGAEVDAVLGERGQGPAAPPRVLTIIHSPRDTMDVLRVTNVEKVQPSSNASSASLTNFSAHGVTVSRCVLHKPTVHYSDGKQTSSFQRSQTESHCDNQRGREVWPGSDHRAEG
jgi:hypothetical protein